MKKKWLVLILTVALGAFACGDDHDHDNNHNNENNHTHNNENNHDHNNENNHDDEFDPEEEGCEHMSEGPFESVDAVASADDSPPNIAIAHTRVDVTLIDDNPDDPNNALPEYSGTVNFVADETAEFLFFLSDDAPLVVKDANGNEVALEASENSTLCPDDIATILTYDLEVGTYTLELGPTEVSEVGFVFEEAGHEDHDHDHDDE